MRRLIAVVAIVVVVVLMAVLIHGCEVSQTNSSLKNYAASVGKYMNESTVNGATMFKDLESGEGTNDIESLQTQLYSLLNNARTQLDAVQGLSVPGQMSSAQRALVETMQLRYNGISQIAGHIEAAMTKSTSVAGVYAISQGTYTLAASDVVYTVSVAPAIAEALHSAGIAVGGNSGVPIVSSQLVTDLSWLNKTDVAIKIGATLPTSAANTAAPGLHGHKLNSVTVDGQTLTPGSTNTVPDSQAPSFTLNLTNGGNFVENQVVCQVTVANLKDKGTSTIPQTKPGETTTCTVTLPTAPPAGTYTVTAGVLPVPGEKNTANNYLTYSVTFN